MSNFSPLYACACEYDMNIAIVAENALNPMIVIYSSLVYLNL